jgi:hypothetical protein
MSTLSRLLSCLLTPPVNDALSWGESPSGRTRKRRASPGCLVSANQAFVGWWVGEKFHSVVGIASDITSRGARILTTQVPPHDHIWIALAKPDELRWDAVKVVQIKESSYGLFQVGLAFKAGGESNVFRALRWLHQWAWSSSTRGSIRRLPTSSDSLHAKSSES